MIILALAATILAQQSSTTTCSNFVGTVRCNTQTQPDPMASLNDTMARNAEASRERHEASARTERELGYIPGCATRFWLIAECSRRQHDDAVAGLARKDALAVLRATVTQKLAVDDCPGAIRTALEGGDMDLAREARDFCRP